MESSNMYHYFGYGHMAYDQVVRALLGRLPDKVQSGHSFTRLEGWQLVTQTLEHVPNIARTHEGITLSPHEVLEKTWGPDFRSYTIFECKRHRVFGTIWVVSAQERELLKEWELIPWGWFQEVEDVPVYGLEITYCSTERLRTGQGYDEKFTVPEWLRIYKVNHEEDAVTFSPLLAPLDLLLEVAQRVGEEFRARPLIS